MLSAILVALVVGAALFAWPRRLLAPLGVAGAAPVGIRLVPPGIRVRVEVLNATDTRGLARRAMFVLRDAGFDVVFYGTTGERKDSTTVLDRTGHSAWGDLVLRAMGGGRVTESPDSSRYVDLTVLVGRNWTPPSVPLYP